MDENVCAQLVMIILFSVSFVVLYAYTYLHIIFGNHKIRPEYNLECDEIIKSKRLHKKVTPQ